MSYRTATRCLWVITFFSLFALSICAQAADADKEVFLDYISSGVGSTEELAMESTLRNLRERKAPEECQKFGSEWVVSNIAFVEGYPRERGFGYKDYMLRKVTVTCKNSTKSLGKGGAAKATTSPSNSEIEAQRRLAQQKIENAEARKKEDAESAQRRTAEEKSKLAQQSRVDAEYKKEQDAKDQRIAKEAADREVVAFARELERRKTCAQPNMRGMCSCIIFQVAPPGGWKACGK